MNSIAVFCGANSGHDPRLQMVARELGQLLANQKITLVYGGSNVGLMGAVADGSLEAGGQVIGVLPRFLADQEVAHRNLTQLHLVETMHERKTKMFELSQGFMALPGGFGTLEEIFEVLTWRQLGLHNWPIAFLNINGYYDSLQTLFAKMEKESLLSSASRSFALFGTNPAALLRLMLENQDRAKSPGPLKSSRQT